MKDEHGAGMAEENRGTSSSLLTALQKSDPAVPEALVLFDRTFVAADARPDFYEWSIHLGFEAQVCPYRLTYYFDIHRHGPALARRVGEQFLTFAATMQTTIPAALERTLVSTVPEMPSILQTVIGIDQRPSGDCRIKYYLVFRDEPAHIVLQILRAAGISTPDARVDVGRTYILGLDFAAEGVDDVKLYFRLNQKHLARVVDNHHDFESLLVDCRDVVFQQCLRRPDRRQMYLHATHDRVIHPWLVSQASHHPAFANVLARLERVRNALAPVRIDPWILSCAYQNRRIDLSTMNIYFHLAHG